MNVQLGRYWPFGLVAIVGQLSAATPPGPSNMTYYWASTAMLALLLLGLVKAPEWSAVPAAGVYLTSIAFLMLATGGINSGLGALLLIPVVAVALYGRPWESAAVTVGVVVPVLAVSFAGSHVPAVTGRRVVVFLAVSIMAAVSVHILRARLRASMERTGALLQQAETMNAAARRLASLLDPASIVDAATELAGEMAAAPTGTAQTAVYLRMEGGRAVLEALSQADVPPEERRPLPGHWEPAEHSLLRGALRSGQPMTGRLDDISASEIGMTHGAWVPVRPEGSLHGVLGVVTRGRAVSDESLRRCIALGHLMELALSNWAAHQRLEQQAAAEERRRIARELHDGLAHELAFIASRSRRSAREGADEEALRHLANAADRALDEARRAITVLSASAPQSLAVALAETAEDLGDRLGVPVSCELAEGVEMPGEVMENLLRIAREAVTNAASHGNPNVVTVRLHDSDGVHLVVEDDGCGFDMDSGCPATGFGLISMRERASSIGARFLLESAPSRGTRIEVALQ